VNYSGGFDLTITIGTKHPEQAWQLIDYPVSPGPLLRYNLAGHTIPPRKSVANSAAYLSANRHVKFFVDELNYARWIPVIVGITEIFAVNNTMYEDAITGKESAADAIATSVPQVQAILATYAKKQ
jgi:ABC-type glycerol-3-phosphate transport system substrate-binding protein